MSNHVKIELCGFCGSGLEEFKGKKILSLNCHEASDSKVMARFFEVYWEGGDCWVISRKSIGNDSAAAPILIEKKAKPLADGCLDGNLLGRHDLIFRDYRAAQVRKADCIVECSIVLLTDKPVRLFFATANQQDFMSFWISDLQNLSAEFNLHEWKWREADEAYSDGEFRIFSGDLPQTQLVGRYPPGGQIGKNGVYGRQAPDGGYRIDIPANGDKPHETLHYPRKDD